MSFKPYTYLIGWSSCNVFYYGVEYSNMENYKIANPKNLWTIYFTSSKIVEEFRKVNGEPDIIQVRKTFESAEEALSWETKVLRRINAVRRKDFLNQSDNVNRRSYLKGKTWSDNRKAAHSALMKEIMSDPEIRKKVSEGRTGKRHSPETRAKMSVSQIGKHSAPRNWNYEKGAISVTFEGVTYKSLSEAANATGFSRGKIRNRGTIHLS